MTPAAFASAYTSDAQLAAQYTGVPWQTILAQWADETGYGTSTAFTEGNNFAGVSAGGSVDSFSDPTAGLSAYITTLTSPLYNSVRAAASGGPDAAAVALGNSPWAQSKYNASGGGPGSDLVNILNTLGLSSTTATDDSSLGSDLGDGAAAVDPGLGIAGSALGSAASGVAGSAASAGADAVVADLRKPLLEAVFVAAGLGLVILGVWKAVAPTVKPAVEDAGKAAAVVAA